MRKEVCLRLPHISSCPIPEGKRMRRRDVHRPLRTLQFVKCSITHGSDIKAYISSPFLTNIFRKHRLGSSKDGNCIQLLEYGLYVICLKH